MTVDEAIAEVETRGGREPDWLLAMVGEIKQLRESKRDLLGALKAWMDDYHLYGQIGGAAFQCAQQAVAKAEDATLA